MPTTDPELQHENARLRERVTTLEAEIAELRRSTAQTVATAQETLYWFERWGLDFNSLFARPEMERLRQAVRAVRAVYRTALNAKRKVLR